MSFPNKNSNWWGVLVQRQPMLSQQKKKHTQMMPMITKDHEQQKDMNVNKK
jgi:hypothetical protein